MRLYLFWTPRHLIGLVTHFQHVPSLRPLALPSTGRLPSTLSATRPVGRRCSRLHRYYAAVRLLRPSGPASAPRLPEPTRDRLGGCGRPEVSQVPTRSLTARTGLRLRWSDGPSQNGPAHVACGGSQRLGLHGKKSFEAQYSPRRLAVYASRPSSPMIPQHSLPGGRYPPDVRFQELRAGKDSPLFIKGAG